MNARRKSNRGNSAIELALVFIPLMFMFLSSFELARGLWAYHTLTTALKSGSRFAMVHGASCIQATATCQITVQDVSSVIKNSSVGLNSSQLQLTLSDGAGTYACGSLATCLTDTTQWPTSQGNRQGSSITIQGQYLFQSVLSSFWPGQGRASINYVATSNDVIEF